MSFSGGTRGTNKNGLPASGRQGHSARVELDLSREELAAYAADVAEQLALLARIHKLDTMACLLDMVRLEASLAKDNEDC